MNSEKVLFSDLRTIFAKHDPACVGVIENNLIDEYDSEIELIIANVGVVKNENDVKELVDFVMNEFFGDSVSASEEMISEIVNILV